MIDHLLRADDALSMVGLLQPLGLASLDENGNPQWAAEVILNVGGPNNGSIRVILTEAVWNRSDPDPRNWTITTPEVLATGFFVIVAEEILNLTLQNLPNNVCKLIKDRDTNTTLFLASDIDPSTLTTARLEPTPAGSDYLN